MKIEELKIGNLILNPHTKEILTIRGIKPQYKRSRNQSTGECFYWLDCDKYDGMNVTVELFSGVPITEEYLIRLGFNIVNENNDGTFNYWNKENDCSIDVETYLLTNKIEKAYRYLLYERRRTKSIIYVHQLQNLFYALNGKELTLI